MSVKSPVRSRYLLAITLLTLVPLTGCSPDMTPKEPDIDAIDEYLQENPEALNYGNEEDAEPDDGGDDGSGE